MRAVSVCAVLTALVSCALANEWATSRDQFCIERYFLEMNPMPTIFGQLFDIQLDIKFNIWYQG